MIKIYYIELLLTDQVCFICASQGCRDAPRRLALFVLYSCDHGASHHWGVSDTGAAWSGSRPTHGKQWSGIAKHSWDHGGLWIP